MRVCVCVCVWVCVSVRVRACERVCLQNRQAKLSQGTGGAINACGSPLLLPLQELGAGARAAPPTHPQPPPSHLLLRLCEHVLQLLQQQLQKLRPVLRAR